MNLDRVFVGDIETKGFLHQLKEGCESDFHVLGVSYINKDNKWEIKTTKDKEDVRKVFENPNNTIVGHNFFLYDIPAIEKLFIDIKVKAIIIDSLFLAWYIEPNRIKQGKLYKLENYGEEFGIKKPEIQSWTNLSYEEYVNRVSEDVKINTNLWVKHHKMLKELYENDEDKLKSLIKFLMTKAQQYKMHQDNPLKLDVESAHKNKETLEGFINIITKELSIVMPKVEKSVIRRPPNNLYKKDGNLSIAGLKWKKLTEGCKLPIEYDGEIKEVIGYELGNPQSVQQVKDWLLNHLGWKPKIFKESILKNGEVNLVPQLRDAEKNLCTSVLELAEKEPAIKQLSNLSMLQHRLGLVKGFLRDCDEQGNIVAGIAGLTNTLRIRHKYLVNLVKPSAPFGEYIRSLILPPKDKILIGADLSSLENTTRNNFIFPYDPEYVKQMDEPYYDSHLEISVIAGLITEEESLFYKWWKEKRKNSEIKLEDIGTIPHNYETFISSYETDEEKQKLHDAIDKKRAIGKRVNFSALYGISKVKLSKELKISQVEAQKLLDAYWDRNWSVKEFSKTCKIKEVGGQMWVENPINKYWYNLRTEKDIFSVINQGHGDYIFTMWISFLMKDGVVIHGGFHDELLTSCNPGEEDVVVEKLKKAIEKVNKALKPNIPYSIDYKIGKNYAEVH